MTTSDSKLGIRASDGTVGANSLPSKTPAPQMVASVLSSWKEIAAYLGRSVRTVQRMEVELGLPIRRPKGHARSSVMAIPHELDEWLKSFTPQRTGAFRANSSSQIYAAGQAIRVLVVDDKEVNLYVVSTNLRSRGYVVDMAQSSRDALKMASLANVVLLDVNLPEIHGFEVLRRLRSNLTTSHIPVICTSATYGAEGAAPLALQLGAKRFLPHPIQPDTLDSAIRDVLGGNGNGSAVQACGGA